MRTRLTCAVGLYKHSDLHTAGSFCFTMYSVKEIKRRGLKITPDLSKWVVITTDDQVIAFYKDLEEAVCKIQEGLEEAVQLLQNDGMGDDIMGVAQKCQTAYEEYVMKKCEMKKNILKMQKKIEPMFQGYVDKVNELTKQASQVNEEGQEGDSDEDQEEVGQPIPVITGQEQA